MMVVRQPFHSIVVLGVPLQPFSVKKVCEDSIKVSHPMFGVPVLPGACILCCKYWTNFILEWRSVSLIVSVVSFSYNSIKTFIQDGNATVPLGPTMHMLAAAEAGALTLVFTNPLWVVKTRLCLQFAVDNKNVKYQGMIQGLSHIYREEGVRGLYKVSDLNCHQNI